MHFLLLDYLICTNICPLRHFTSKYRHQSPSMTTLRSKTISSPSLMTQKLRFCPSCQILAETSEEELSVVCTRCGQVIEQSSVSDSIDMFDKDYGENRRVVSAINKGLVYLKSGSQWGSPAFDRQMKYKVRKKDQFNAACFLSHLVGSVL